MYLNFYIGEDEVGFYNIRWYDAPETDIATGIPQDDDKDVKTSGQVCSNSSEDDTGTGSGATSVSSGSSDCLEFDIPRKAFVPLNDVYSAPDDSPGRSVPVGPNHQATIPDWKGGVNKTMEFTGKYDDNSPSSGLVLLCTVDDNERRLMGTSVLAMADTGFYSSKYKEFGEGRTECNCLDQGSIRCVRQHVREARKIMRKILGNENFVNLGFSDMGEDVAFKWSEEEEAEFHEVVYNNLASSGRNFWRHLSAAFPSRTKKDIVSYYFNVFMLRKRAAQNRSRYLEIDSDDDECHSSNAGFEASEDKSAIESLDEQDVCVENQDTYSDDDDDSDDDNSDYGTPDDNLGSAEYYMGNTTEEEGGIEQRSLKCAVNSQIESLGTPLQHVDWTSGIAKGDFVGQDDSCMSFECQTNMDVPPVIHKEDFGVQDDSCLSFEYETSMDVSCYPCGLVDASLALHAGGLKCDQSPHMPSNIELSSHMMEHAYLLEHCSDKDWCPGYSTGPATDIDLLPTSNLIEEFFGHRTPDRNTRSD